MWFYDIFSKNLKSRLNKIFLSSGTLSKVRYWLRTVFRVSDKQIINDQIQKANRWQQHMPLNTEYDGNKLQGLSLGTYNVVNTKLVLYLNRCVTNHTLNPEIVTLSSSFQIVLTHTKQIPCLSVMSCRYLHPSNLF